MTLSSTIMVHRFTFLALTTALLLAVPTQAQETRINAPDGAPVDRFGSSVAVSSDGQHILVGARSDDKDGSNVGSAYVFERLADGSWLQEAKLTISDTNSGADSFGRAVAMSGDGEHALIDHGLEEDAHVFSRQPDGTWQEQDVLTASDGEFGDSFGFAVAMSHDGQRVLVGAKDFTRPGAFSAGGAYVFTRQPDGSYTQEAKLLASTYDGDDFFGNSVSITPDGERALIGAVGDGSAFVFDRQPDGSWVQQTNFEDVDGDVFNDFGRDVSISDDGTRALVGADGDVDGGFSNQGSAYVFAQQPDGTWAQQAALFASDGANDSHFGFSVALSAAGTRALIGADQDDVDGEERQGSAYVFARQTDGSWVQQTKITASDGEETDRFGGSVAISANGQRGLIGAEQDVVNGNLSQGSAYAYGPASLPVELASFTAQTNGRTAVLSWRTASETNNAGFRVERRTDDTEPWARLDFVESKAEGGTTSKPLTYQFRVDDLDLGDHAFRLVQVDVDGTATPSEIMEVSVGLDAVYAVSEAYPNPAVRGRATVEVAVQETQPVRAAVYDMLGRRVAVLHDGPLAAQKTHRLTLETSRWTSGTYFVRVNGAHFTAMRKVVVAR